MEPVGSVSDSSFTPKELEPIFTFQIMINLLWASACFENQNINM